MGMSILGSLIFCMNYRDLCIYIKNHLQNAGLMARQLGDITINGQETLWDVVQLKLVAILLLIILLAIDINPLLIISAKAESYSVTFLRFPSKCNSVIYRTSCGFGLGFSYPCWHVSRCTRRSNQSVSVSLWSSRAACLFSRYSFPINRPHPDGMF